MFALVGLEIKKIYYTGSKAFILRNLEYCYKGFYKNSVGKGKRKELIPTYILPEPCKFYKLKGGE